VELAEELDSVEETVLDTVDEATVDDETWRDETVPLPPVIGN